jgi:hypothetical protein
MTVELTSHELFSPATNGTVDGSGSAVSVVSNRGTEQTGDPATELSTAANRFLVAEMNRLIEENRQLKHFEEKYYELKDKYYGAQKRLAVLKETLKRFRTHHFLSSACLIAGSAGIAAAPNLPLTSYGWYVFVSVCAMLLVAGIASRVDRDPTGTTTH